MKVFISYRRMDNMYLPSLLRDEFAAKIGTDSVFFDVDSIPIATDFATHISSWIARTDVFLVLIGPNWRPALLTNEHDFVRQELLCAHRLDKTVLPVLHSNQAIPNRSEVPADFEWLLYRNAFVIGPPPAHVEHIRSLVDAVIALRPAQSILDHREPEGGLRRRQREPSLDFISESPTASAMRAKLRRLWRKEVP